jgi:hypothetical protein
VSIDVLGVDGSQQLANLAGVHTASGRGSR